MSDLTAFRETARTWLAENFPASLKGKPPPVPAGFGAKFDGDMKPVQAHGVWGAADGGVTFSALTPNMRGFERAGAITPPAKNMAAVLFFAVADAGRG